MEPDPKEFPERTLHTQMHGGNGFRDPDSPWLIGAVLTSRWRRGEGRELYEVKEDAMQRNDLAQDFPDVVKRLRAQHLRWYQSLKPQMVPSRIVLGSDSENPTDLTSQEWVMPSGGPPWARSHVVKRMIAT